MTLRDDIDHMLRQMREERDERERLKIFPPSVAQARGSSTSNGDGSAEAYDKDYARQATPRHRRKKSA